MKKDWEIRHLGFIVSDMDKAIEHYKSLVCSDRFNCTRVFPTS
jgi:hypothetical protein